MSMVWVRVVEAEPIAALDLPLRLARTGHAVVAAGAPELEARAEAEVRLCSARQGPTGTTHGQVA
jgi:hypothetical protein